MFKTKERTTTKRWFEEGRELSREIQEKRQKEGKKLRKE